MKGPEPSFSWASLLKELFPFKEVLCWRTYFVFFRKLLQQLGSQRLAGYASMGRFELYKPSLLHLWSNPSVCLLGVGKHYKKLNKKLISK